MLLKLGLVCYQNQLDEAGKRVGIERSSNRALVRASFVLQKRGELEQVTPVCATGGALKPV